MGKKKVKHRSFGQRGQYKSSIRAESEEIDPITKAEAEALYERDLFEDLDDYEKQARETLEAAGLPKEFHRPYRRADGSVCADLGGLIDDNRKLEPEGYAARIMEKIEDTRAYLAAGNTIQATRAAMLLQYLVDHQHFSKYEYQTLVGTKQLDCHTTYSDEDRAEWVRLTTRTESGPHENQHSRIC